MRHASIALTADKRCPLCTADYDRFRPGLSFGHVAGELSAGDKARENSRAAIRDADARTFRGRAAVLAEMSARKRAAWDEQHGPGRCFPDVWAPVVARTRAFGLPTEEDRAWNLREVIAELLLEDEDDHLAGQDASVGHDLVDVSFDVDTFDAVPSFIDDGQATTCIAA